MTSLFSKLSKDGTVGEMTNVKCTGDGLLLPYGSTRLAKRLACYDSRWLCVDHDDHLAQSRMVRWYR